ncbi:MAG: hypothetical protein EOO15_08245 [Chitinophagaceae bacterium]|nr:MAG: hypothetical protein EOO15_08245 [Chitinophagaceae bacterium]
MDEQAFLQRLSDKARELHINPFLLLAGLEGLYTFREVPLNALNLEYLDSLILTLFALRIGDQFHGLAEASILEGGDALQAAARELEVISEAELAASDNPHLRSFAGVLQGGTPVRRYHEKALEAAAREVALVQQRYGNDARGFGIGAIMIDISKNELSDVLPLGSLFSA